jgi:hypothetical protein
MAVPLAVAGLALGAIGTGYSIYKSERAEDKAEAMRIQEEQRLEEQFQRDWAAYTGRKGYLEKLRADPSLHPEFLPWKKGLETEHERRVRETKAGMRRRGITKGPLEAALSKLEQQKATGLEEAMGRVSRSAEEELSRLAPPVKGQLAPTYGTRPPQVDFGQLGGGVTQLGGLLYALEKYGREPGVAEQAGLEYQGTLGMRGTDPLGSRFVDEAAAWGPMQDFSVITAETLPEALLRASPAMYP